MKTYFWNDNLIFNPPVHLPGDVVPGTLQRAPVSSLQNVMFSVYKMVWCWRLGGVCQETPVNQEKQKTVPYKMPVPGSLPSPNAKLFLNLCLIKWLVWSYLKPDTYPHSPGNTPLFFFPAPFFQSPFLHCLKWSLNSVVKWLPRRDFVKKRPSYKRFAQQKARLLQNGMVQWAQVVTKCHLFKTHASETMTSVMPFHSGNAHGDDF